VALSVPAAVDFGAVQTHPGVFVAAAGLADAEGPGFGEISAEFAGLDVEEVTANPGFYHFTSPSIPPSPLQLYPALYQIYPSACFPH